MVADQLFLVIDILRLTEQFIDKVIDKENINEESCRVIKDVVEKCERKIKTLNEIFRYACSEDDASRVERYSKTVKTTFKEKKVENLMQEILKDVQLLNCEHDIIADKTRTEQVFAVITELTILSSSQKTEITTFHFDLLTLSITHRENSLLKKKQDNTISMMTR